MRDVQVVEDTPPLDRNAKASKTVVTYRRRYTARHLLLVVAEGGSIAAGLSLSVPISAIPFPNMPLSALPFLPWGGTVAG